MPGPLQGVVPGPKVAWTALSPVPTDGRDPKQEWTGYIPFDQLPQVFDPADGVVETANARITPDDYPYPVTLDWGDPYRQERIWKVLHAKQGMAAADMLALQTDVYSDLDRVVAERLAYAIDHAAAAGHGADGKDRDGHLNGKEKRLRQAADLMRQWDGTVKADAAAPAIVDAARAALWPMILTPQLGLSPSGSDADSALELYHWGSKAYAEEQIIVNQPGRWLPAKYANWNELLAAAVETGMEEAHAPECWQPEPVAVWAGASGGDRTPDLWAVAAAGEDDRDADGDGRAAAERGWIDGEAGGADVWAVGAADGGLRGSGSLDAERGAGRVDGSGERVVHGPVEGLVCGDDVRDAVLGRCGGWGGEASLGAGAAVVRGLRFGGRVG